MDAHTGFRARDRSAIITTTILQIIRQALLTWLHHGEANLDTVRAEIEDILRDEFFDIERQIAADRIEGDPAQPDLFVEPLPTKGTIFDGFIQSQLKSLRSRIAPGVPGNTGTEGAPTS